MSERDYILRSVFNIMELNKIFSYISDIREKSKEIVVVFGFIEPESFGVREAKRKVRSYGQVLDIAIACKNTGDLINCLKEAKYTKLAKYIEEGDERYFVNKLRFLKDLKWDLSKKFEIPPGYELRDMHDQFYIPDEESEMNGT